jgi:hypothetical protein
VNTIRILFQANIFPLKKFDTWEASATKTYPSLKTFFHEACGQRLTAMALRITSGQNGYANQNMHNVLEGNNDTDKDTVTTIMQTAAATTTTGTTPQVRPAVNADITTAITQLAKRSSCRRWRQCCLHRPRLNTLASAQHIPSAANPAGGHIHAVTLSGG